MHVDGVTVPVDDKMRGAVEVWLDYVGTKSGDVLIERKLTLPWRGIYGYADTIVGDEVIDFKFGFVLVRADARQLAYYLIAWLIEALRRARAEQRRRARPSFSHARRASPSGRTAGRSARS